MNVESKFVWHQGELVPYEKATIHFLNTSFHYGTGVFEGIKCYNTPNGPAIFKLKEHMERLHQSATNYKMKISISVDELCNGTKKLVKSNDLTDSYIRPIAFYGYDTLGVLI